MDDFQELADLRRDMMVSRNVFDEQIARLKKLRGDATAIKLRQIAAKLVEMRTKGIINDMPVYDD